jgi:hypothetical protein
MLKSWVYWSLFALASVLLSECLRTFKAFTVSPDLGNGLMLAGFLVAMLAVVITLLLHHYKIDHQEGRLANRVALFDWLLTRMGQLKATV